ncbi:hypothetical protein BGZ73_007553 [Actinomortierella ambigua]|nr:hypothetical protein BGZ73_007553 [Actinomortierella ambigua]
MGKRKTKSNASAKKKKLFTMLGGGESLLSAAAPALAPVDNSATTLTSTGKVHLSQGPDSHNGPVPNKEGMGGGGDHREPSAPIAPAMEPNSSNARDTSLFQRSSTQEFPPPPLIPGKADHRFNVFIKGLEPDMDSRALFDLFKPFGFVLSCKAVMDLSTGKCRGHGFVLYDNEASVREARRALTPLGYYVSVAFDHVSLKHFENTGILNKPEKPVPLPSKKSVPQIDNDSEFPCLPSSRSSHPTAWSARGNIRPASTDSDTGTPELSTSSSLSSPHPDHLQDSGPIEYSSATMDKGQQPSSPVLLPPTLSNFEPYSEPLGKTLFGFDSGFFGSRVGMQMLDGTLGFSNGAQQLAEEAGKSGTNFSSDVFTSLRNHNEEALYRDRDNQTLYIQNLGLDCNDQKLWQICSEFGTVISAKAIVDPWTGICEGHGFVTFDTELTAVRALRAMRARGYTANLPGESTDLGQAVQPVPQPSDLYQISNRLDDSGHGPLNVLLSDYLHQLANDTRAQDPFGYHVGFNASSPGAMRNGIGSLQPFFDSHERDDFPEELLEPDHNPMDSSTIYFSNLTKNIKHRNLLELCASYGPLVLHLHDLEIMDDACSEGKGQVQFVSSHDAWKALEGLMSLRYTVQVGCFSTANNDPVVSEADFPDAAALQWQDQAEEPMVYHATCSEMACQRPSPLQQQQQDHERVDNDRINASPPTPPLASATAIAHSSPRVKNDSIMINKVFSFADAVKKAPPVLPPTPPLSILNGKAPATRKPQPPFDKLGQFLTEGSTAQPATRESPQVIRMPIPTERGHDCYSGGSANGGPGLRKLGGVQNKLDKSEYRMNLFVRDLEPAMTDLKLYEICAQ